MDTRIIVLTALAALLLAGGIVRAVEPGKTLTFEKGPMGIVTFDGQRHAGVGLKCADCHREGLFPERKKGAQSITMQAIFAGKLCGSCHNGERAFQATGNCMRCHKG